MSVVTRILVCLIPFAAIVYLGSIATMQAYRPVFRDQYVFERATRKDDVEKRDEIIRQKSAEIDRLVWDIELRKNQIIDLDHEIEVKTQQKTELLVEIEKIKRDTLQIKADIDNLRENVFKREEALVKQLEGENEVIRQELEEVIADKAHSEARLAQLQDAAAKLDADIRQARDQLFEAEKEARRKGLILAILERRNVPIEKIVDQLPAHADIDGRILSSDPRNHVYLIDKGEGAGVKPGNRFVVFRGETYVGTLVVRRVFAEQAAAEEVKDEKAMRMDPAVGDSATTIIYNTKPR